MLIRDWETSTMLRVTVSRETAAEAVPIAEVVIGKFAGTEERGVYAARVIEPPSQYSDGVDACFAIRGHERYQPAFALVAEVLSAWQAGRTDQVNEGARAVLDRALRLFDDPAPAVDPAPAAVSGVADVIDQAAAALTRNGGDPAMIALAQAVLAIARRPREDQGGIAR